MRGVTETKPGRPGGRCENRSVRLRQRVERWRVLDSAADSASAPATNSSAMKAGLPENGEPSGRANREPGDAAGSCRAIGRRSPDQQPNCGRIVTLPIPPPKTAFP